MFVTTDADCKLWIFAGADSTFEGFTQHYPAYLTDYIEGCSGAGFGCWRQLVFVF